MKQQTQKTKGIHGGTLLGFLAGLVTGLILAVVVAMYITKAPIPFGGKGLKAEDGMPSPGDKTLSDPNVALYPKQPTPNIDTPFFKSRNEAAKPEATSTLTEPVKKEGVTGGSEQIAYLVQAGAYKTLEDAENMKARLALLGVEAKVSTTEINAKSLYRVRAGPYPEIEAQITRKRLNENGIEGSVVKQKP